jgi:ribosomal protein S18 acetylase RimI-like enzyme
MTLHDWCDAPAEWLAPVYECERQRWIRTLQWDPAPAWREVERARTTWGLPGLLVLDKSKRVRGLAFYVIEDDRLDLAGITADDVSATDLLLDGLLQAARGAGATWIRTLTFDGASSLRSGLKVRGFDVHPHQYLSRSLHPSASRPAGFDRTESNAMAFDTWRDTDIEPMARLLRRAYEPAEAVLFAPHGEPAEWERYVRNLVTHAGCGVLNRHATQSLREGDEIRAAALMTDISPRTAHLVQLAVDPSARGRRMGRSLVDAVCTRLIARDYQAVTLLVSSGNKAARALYDSAGFRPDATFLAATLRLGGAPRAVSLGRETGRQPVPAP